MEKDFDFLVYIGRFQPFHKGHAKIVDYALQRSDKIIFLLGSNNKTRTEKNPFTFEERSEIIEKSLPYQQGCFLFRPLDDFDNDEDWLKEVKIQTKIAVETIGQNYNTCKIGLIGMSKDDSTYYLDYFKNWNFVEFPKVENPISSTEVREWIFHNKKIDINEYLYYGAYDFILQNMRKLNSISIS